MVLLDLPEELLDLVCEAIHDDDDEIEARMVKNRSPNLLNFALTSRFIYKIASTWLQREVRIHHPSPRADALLQRLRETPSEGNRIRSLFIWNKEDAYTGDSSELDFLLKAAVNLHELYVPFFPSRALSSSLLDEKLECAKTLELICLDGNHSYGIADLFRMLSFPRLQSFQIFRFNDTECCADLPCQLPLLPLTCLRLTSCQIGMPMFDAIISSCSKLQQLEFLLPFPEQVHEVPDSWNITWASARVFIPLTLSMLPIAVRLNRFKDTLTELHILTNRQFWQDHDGTKLDLSDFKSLKFLWASSNCFFHCSSEESARQGFYRLLPSSLCYLDMVWGQDSGIFFPNPGVPLPLIRIWYQREFEGDNDHTWILELARQKKTHLPRLREVEFHEDMMQPLGEGVHEMSDWKPSTVMNEFASAGITLTVMYRVMQYH
ncbi:hypothetical protein B0J11DRAFT_510456 [Dendryphion nanum]|uniref:Uncharacterized protein n=1 Tax=Dendryphion nanum TaxID=256645 RepID=A0A9P9DBW4_9PLEO|nr:hypothetical protein B0J11DRAFT_510456 [Dendryphion nanum]